MYGEAGWRVKTVARRVGTGGARARGSDPGAGAG